MLNRGSSTPLNLTATAPGAIPRGQMPTPLERPASIYRYFDRDDILLYVGSTRAGLARNQHHSIHQFWWPLVSRQEVEHFPTQAEARERERALISELRPAFNQRHNPGPSERVDPELLDAARSYLIACEHHIPSRALDQFAIWLAQYLELRIFEALEEYAPRPQSIP